MGRQTGDQTSLFYEFRLDDRIPKGHLLRRINDFWQLFWTVCMSNLPLLQRDRSALDRPGADGPDADCGVLLRPSLGAEAYPGS